MIETLTPLLPYVFAFLMGLAMLVYSLLDGYDLGVGILSKIAPDDEKDIMIASIGPFWDANETWLVLGVGLLLVAFPIAHGIVLSSLYLPVAMMLVGLILRGVAFDFRAKSKPEHKGYWNDAFFGGSLLCSVSQGYMLGSYILGFKQDIGSIGFCMLVGLCAAAGYGLIGAAWLIMKTEGQLQRKSVTWARVCLWLSTLGIAMVSLSTPLVSERIFDRWFMEPNIYFLLPIPVLTAVLIVFCDWQLKRLPQPKDRRSWVPFVVVSLVNVLCFLGLAYSFYPYIVPDQLTIVQAASASQSLWIMLVGALLVLPVMFGYTFYAYKVFHGKATELTYH